MKKLLILSSLAVLFFACQKQTTPLNQQTPRDEYEILGYTKFENFNELFEYFDEMKYPGDAIVAAIKDENCYLVSELSNQSMPISKHMIESTNKISFAKECDKWLKQNPKGCLEIEYDEATGIYWADSVPC